MNKNLKMFFTSKTAFFVFYAFNFFAILCCFLSCQSSKNISSDALSPTAIISITGTNLVAWKSTELNDNDENLDTDGAFNSLVNRAIDSQNPEILTAKDRLDYAEESFRLITGELLGWKILPKEQVIKSDAYKYAYRSIFNSLSDSTSATGYKDMTVTGSKQARLLMKEFEAKSLVAMDFNFKKIIATGNRQNGKVAALVFMKIKILDSTGREIINEEYTVQSSQTVLIRNGSYDKDEFLEIINKTIDETITVFSVKHIN